MSTEKWIAGSLAGLTYTNAFSSTTLNSVGSGSAILSDLALDNSTTLDMFCDLSIAFGSVAFAAPAYCGIYVYPLNKDGTTYGDGRFATATAAAPPAQYIAGNISLVATTSSQAGTLRGIILPPGQFKFVLYNQGGIALSSSGNTCVYRTYNRSIA